MKIIRQHSLIYVLSEFLTFRRSFYPNYNSESFYTISIFKLKYEFNRKISRCLLLTLKIKFRYNINRLEIIQLHSKLARFMLHNNIYYIKEIIDRD